MARNLIASVCSADAQSALERVAGHLAKVDGFSVTGQVSVKSERHLLWNVEFVDNGGCIDECWVVLTSYGISPSADLGSRWESVLGASA